MESQSIRKLSLIVFTAALLVPPIAQAGSRPDDRAGLRGAQPASAQTAVRPDDRAGLRGAQPSSVQVAAVRPNDRAGALGVGSGPVDRSASSQSSVAISSDGFGWAKAAMGIALAVALAGLTIAILRVLRHQRAAAST
ncbi:MAG: hypothetical protein ACJ757_05365 [Gaiellaceae bacterium]